MHHLRALRLAVGGSFEAIVGPGAIRVATIESLDRRAAVVRLGAPIPTDADPESDVTVAVALADLGRFDTVVEKATELGATRLLPLRAERTQVASLSESRRARWVRIARAACEQCGRTRPPEIEAPATIHAAVAALPPATRLVVFTPDATERWDGGDADTPLALFIGPEGGFSPGEVAALRDAGAEARSLGPRILRFETAAAAALAIAGLRRG